MTDYEPGTVAVATVRGVEGVRVMRTDGTRGGVDWLTPEIVGGQRTHSLKHVNYIRPLVVLNLDALGWKPEALSHWLREMEDRYRNSTFTPRVERLGQLADQIEAQTKPPRIPEPGLYGVVTASTDSAANDSFVNFDGSWQNADGHAYLWAELIDPTLIREGVES